MSDQCPVKGKDRKIISVVVVIAKQTLRTSPISFTAREGENAFCDIDRADRFSGSIQSVIPGEIYWGAADAAATESRIDRSQVG